MDTGISPNHFKKASLTQRLSGENVHISSGIHFWIPSYFDRYPNISLFVSDVFRHFAQVLPSAIQIHLSSHNSQTQLSPHVFLCAFAKFEYYFLGYLCIYAAITLFTIPRKRAKISTIFLKFTHKYISFSAKCTEMNLFPFSILRLSAVYSSACSFRSTCPTARMRIRKE